MYDLARVVINFCVRLPRDTDRVSEASQIEKDHPPLRKIRQEKTPSKTRALFSDANHIRIIQYMETYIVLFFFFFIYYFVLLLEWVYSAIGGQNSHTNTISTRVLNVFFCYPVVQFECPLFLHIIIPVLYIIHNVYLPMPYTHAAENHMDVGTGPLSWLKKMK